MNENAKLYVFERKEVILIFLFMFVTAVTSFVFGVKVGKNFSYQQAGLTQTEKTKLELLSNQEEVVEEVVKEQTAQPADQTKVAQDSHDRLKAIIDKQFAEGTQAGSGAGAAPVPPKAEVKKEEVIDVKQDVVETKSEAAAAKATLDKYTGKWTIQLGAYRTLEEAERFSDGFRVRGYNPIINEVELSGKGNWYRVSLGVFETLAEAKEYVLKERTLFEGQDYVFGRFE